MRRDTSGDQTCGVGGAMPIRPYGSSTSVEAKTATATRDGSAWKRRRSPPTEPTLGDHIGTFRKLSGAARRKAEAEFVQRARGFVMSCCSWYFGDDLDRDDVIAEAQAALWGAVVDWRPDGGAPFDTFARWRLRTALRGLLRRSRMVRGYDCDRFVSLDEEATS